MQKKFTQTTICASGLNTLYNIGLNPTIDQSLDISFTDPFYLNADLCKFINRYAYQGMYIFKTIDGDNTTVGPTLYIDGKDMGTLESLKIQEIKALAEPSPFGHGSKTVYDENVRKASEIKGNRINLDFILPEEVQAMAPAGSQITAKLYKLAIYEKDGFFADHSDTQHGEDHIGTLVMCLPVPHEGGTFILSDDGNELRLPFDEMIGGDCIPWVAFYTDVKHQVEVVKSGMRMTLQFDLKVEPREDDDPCNNNLSSIIEGKGIYRTNEYKCKLQDLNHDIIKTIQNKLKTILSSKTHLTEIKPEDSSLVIKKKDRTDDDEAFELEQPQPTKQPKLDSLGQNDDGEKDVESKNPDGIAILLGRRYGATSLSPETLKGIDSILYHALKGDFKVEVKLVVMEQRSDYKGEYKGQPIEVVALSKISELNDSSSEEEEKPKMGPNKKYIPKMDFFRCKENFQRFKHPSDNRYYYEEEKEEEKYAGEVKKVYLVTGMSPKAISKLVSQKYNEHTGNEAQEAIYSYMQAALFIYPK